MDNQSPNLFTTEALKAALDTCGREPIHRPGGIQAWGALILFDTTGRVNATANTQAVLGISPAGLIGRSTAEVAASLGLMPLEPPPVIVSPRYIRARRSTLSTGKEVYWDSVLCSDGWALEFEPALAADLTVSEELRHAALTFGHTATSVETAAQHATDLLLAASGYERCIVYCFDEDWCGTVISESVVPGLEQRFLGHRFPASDIPVQARALYTASLMRIIVDSGAAPAPIEGGDALSFDIGLALPRAVSPVHLQYLRNMDVRATLVLSLLVEGQLWGMLVCHHSRPHRPTLEARIFAQELATRLAGYIGQNMWRAHAEQHRRLYPLLADIRSAPAPIGEHLQNLLPALMALFEADGVAYRIGTGEAAAGLLTVMPSEPPRDDSHPKGTVFAFDRHSPQLSLPPDWPDTALGGLVIPLNAYRDDVLIIVRAERIEELRWAGNPHKALVTDVDGMQRLTPRASFDLWVEAKTGTARPFSAVALGLAGALQGALAHLRSQEILQRELGLRVAAQMRLQEEQERQQQFLDLTQIWLWETDASGAVQFAGGGTAEGPAVLSAVRPGIRLPDLIDRLFMEPGRTELLGLLRQQTAIRDCLLELRSADTEPGTILLNAVPRRGVEGDFRGWRLAVADITEQLHQKVRMAELNAAVTAKNRFVASVSHDLRQPLQALALYADLAADLTVEPPLVDIIARIRALSGSMNELVSALLDVGRIEGDLVRPVLAEVDLGPLLQRLIEEYGAMPYAAGKSVHARLKPALVISDAGLLERLLRNLLQNAVKFAKARILVGIRPHRHEILLEICDDGPGIAPENQDAVFRAWEARDRLPNYGVEGSGLGLGTARRVAETLGVGLQLRSALGRGTRFSLTLPSLWQKHVPSKQFAGRSETAGQAGGFCLILIVEDDDAVRAALTATLTQLGHTVFAFNSVESVLASDLDGLRIDISIIDLHLGPGLGGEHLVEELARRRQFTQTRLFILTGESLRTVHQRTNHLPVAGILQKPLDPSSFLKRLGLLPGGVEIAT